MLLSVVIWLLAIWIGGFFRNIGIATPKGNNLLTYTLILLVRVARYFSLLDDNLMTTLHRSLVSLSVCLALQQQQWPSALRSSLGDRPSYRS